MIATGPLVDGRPLWELRLGRWQDVLLREPFPVACSIVTDPPYSADTNEGQRSAKGRGKGTVNSVELGSWTEHDARLLVQLAQQVEARWLVAFGDHLTAEWLRRTALELGWRGFPPVPWVKEGAAPRFQGDGPAPQHETLCMCRARRRMQPGEARHRPGWYQGPARDSNVVRLFAGQKPPWLLRALVRDYSQPGDLVLDPYAGSGSTMLAALVEGRRALGIEADPKRFELACRALQRGFTPDMFARHDSPSSSEQLELQQ